MRRRVYHKVENRAPTRHFYDHVVVGWDIALSAYRVLFVEKQKRIVFQANLYTSVIQFEIVAFSLVFTRVLLCQNAPHSLVPILFAVFSINGKSYTFTRSMEALYGEFFVTKTRSYSIKAQYLNLQKLIHIDFCYKERITNFRMSFASWKTFVRREIDNNKKSDGRNLSTFTSSFSM